MALTADQMAAVTLGEFEEMARRFGAALTVLREAQALIGAPAAQSVVSTSASSQTAAPPVDPEAWRRGLRADQQAFLEEQRNGNSERNRLLEQMRAKDIEDEMRVE